MPLLGPRPRFRPEVFGGILASERPAALVWIDRERARALGLDGGAAWAGPEPADPLTVRLSAPVEVHLELTSRCAARCRGCYTGSTPAGAGPELDTAAWEAAIDELAAAGVFHVALGGGESLLRDDLLGLARHARTRGIVPNLTTSGAGVTEAWAAAAARVFGAVHVSLDGPAEVDRESRGADLFATAEQALRRLRRHTRRVGINCVVSRVTLPHLDRLGALARRLRVRTLELLRFKPAGRGAALFDSLDPTPEQRAGFLEQALALRRSGLEVRLDCSLVPLLAAGGNPPDRAARFGVTGCEAGRRLAAVRSDGRVTACSFWEAPEEGDVRDLRRLWRRPGAFEPFASWCDDPPAPCRGCAWLRVCRGGCRAVALHVRGDPRAPDPICGQTEWTPRAVG